MTDQHQDLLWRSPEWLEQATEWIHTELNRLGMHEKGPVEQMHVRPWATVMRISTDRGNVFFKADGQFLAREIPVTLGLSRERPDCVPQVLSADVERGWMLMEDGGERLRDVTRTKKDLSHWDRLLPIYSQLQVQVAGRRDEFLALGALDRRLQVLPDLYTDLLKDHDSLRLGRKDGLDQDKHARLTALAPRVQELCQELAGFSIPESIEHNDFHDGNILVKRGSYVFFDWGDCCISHPFSSMLVARRMIIHRFELGEDDPILKRLNELYLTPWERYGTAEELQKALELACHTGMICRALAWRQVLPHAGEMREDFQSGLLEWLGEILDMLEARS